MILVPLIRDHRANRACRDFGDTLLALRRAATKVEEELDEIDEGESAALFAVPSE